MCLYLQGFGLGDGEGGFFEGGEGEVRVDFLQGGEQAAGEDNLQIVATLRGVAVTGEVGAVGVAVATGAEPIEAELFEVVFGNSNQVNPHNYQ